MDIKTFDIILLFILAITVALIIGFNVLYVIDKKMSNVKINIPPCPVPNVYIKSPLGKLIKVDVDNLERDDINNNSITNTNNIPNRKIKIAPNKFIQSHTMNRRSNNESFNSKKIEGFETVNKDKLPLVVNENGKNKKVELKQGYNSTGSDTPNTGNKITYPKARDIVRYNNHGCYKNIKTNELKKITTKTNAPVCNKSVEDNKINNIKTGFIGADGKIVGQSIDFYIPRTYMGEDPYIRGPSYAEMKIEQQADVDQIGSIPVNNYNGEPVPLCSFIMN